ncbi:MAG TPA: chemotaxis protein CheW [Gammaproteobacteria bacterium]|nr:chemotaxis protein CheW [Gammaproteobacteria bacterium]
MLLPIAGGRMILPRVSVTEVTGFVRPKNRPDDAPAWLLGKMNWQGHEIPMLSFEAACGRDVPELGRRARIAIVQTIGGYLQPSVFALVTQGYPYLIRVHPGVLQVEDSDTDAGVPILVRLRIANEKPVVPDLEELERMLADALGIDTSTRTSPSLAGDESVGEDSFSGTNSLSDSNLSFDDD